VADEACNQGTKLLLSAKTALKKKCQTNYSTMNLPHTHSKLLIKSMRTDTVEQATKSC